MSSTCCLSIQGKCILTDCARAQEVTMDAGPVHSGNMAVSARWLSCDKTVIFVLLRSSEAFVSNFLVS